MIRRTFFQNSARPPLQIDFLAFFHYFNIEKLVAESYVVETHWVDHHDHRDFLD
jgi:hypothetical protein